MTAAQSRLGYTLRLSVNPSAIIADGNSSTTISAEVRDSTGRPAADDTQVEFTTSLGIVEHIGFTSAGIARVQLKSGAAIGTALVSAVVRKINALAQIRIDFLEPGTILFDESFVTISSDEYLAYDPDQKIIDSAGGVSIKTRGVNITADSCQIITFNNVIKAKAKLGGDNIKIFRGEKSIQASAVYYDIKAMHGFLITPIEEGAQLMEFRTGDMRTSPVDDNQKSPDFNYKQTQESSVVITAKYIILHPDKEVKIKRATFYMEGDKLLRVPLYKTSLRSGYGLQNSFLAVGSDGLRLDFPLYYQLTEVFTGSARIKHSEPGGWGYYTGRAGWQLNLEEEYYINGSTDGKFIIDRAGTNDWGLSWNHRNEFGGNSRLYSYINFAEHKDIYTSINYNKGYQNLNLAFNMRANHTRDSNNRYISNAYINTKQKQLIPGKIDYNLSGGVFFDHRESKIISPSQNDDKLTTESFGASSGISFYSRPWVISRDTNINSSLVYFRNWKGADTGNQIYANLGIFKYMGDRSQLGLYYSYNWDDSRNGSFDHSISSDFGIGGGGKWDLHLNATRTLQNNTTSAFGEFALQFLPSWRLSLLSTYQEYETDQFSDLEVILSKQIGNQEARLIWSKELQAIKFDYVAGGF